MTAESIKPKKQRMTKPRRQMPKPGSKTSAILTLTTTTPARPQEIAESVKCSKQLVSNVLQRYGIEPNTVDSYKNNRAEIFAGLQDKILKTVDIDDIKEASVLQRITSAGILYDKERLERGQTTQNIGALIGMIHQIQDDRDAA
jgi:hypothetical protein